MRIRLLFITGMLLASCGNEPVITGEDSPTPASSLATTTTEFAAVVTFRDASGEEPLTTSTVAVDTTTPETATPQTTAAPTTVAPTTAPVTTAVPVTTVAPSCPNVTVGETDLTVSAEPFDGDGDGQPDILQTYRDNEAKWHMQVLWASGGGSDVVLDAFAQSPVRPLGGFDVDGDGRDEAFVVTDTGASAQIISLYSTMTDCVLQPILIDGTNTIYTMIIAGSLGQPAGVECNGTGKIVEKQASILDWDTGEYTFETYRRSLFAATMSVTFGFDIGVFTSDEAAAFAQLNCGSLHT